MPAELNRESEAAQCGVRETARRAFPQKTSNLRELDRRGGRGARFGAGTVDSIGAPRVRAHGQTMLWEPVIMTHHPSHPETSEPAVDVAERGAPKNGVPQTMDRRLFMQLLVFAYEGELAPGEFVRRLSGALEAQGAPTVLYEDVNHPSGFGLLSWSEDPTDFVTKLRPALTSSDLTGLKMRPEFTMLGRSYSSGFEDDLKFWLLDRPIKTVTNPAWPWAIWYPLRRIGAFEKLEGREKGSILREHAVIGKRYGNADLAHDVRLACHGLDANDNEFVIGLIGKELHPLSHVVQTMRGTRQTSEYIGHMGPFFVGRALHAR